MLQELHAALTACRHVSVHAVILAAVAPVFSAGHNLKELVG